MKFQTYEGETANEIGSILEETQITDLNPQNTPKHKKK